MTSLYFVEIKSPKTVSILVLLHELISRYLSDVEKRLIDNFSSRANVAQRQCVRLGIERSRVRNSLASSGFSLMQRN